MMRTNILREFIVAMSIAVIAALAIVPQTIGADTTTPPPPPASGACCGVPPLPPLPPLPPPPGSDDSSKCGEGTHMENGKCVVSTRCGPGTHLDAASKTCVTDAPPTP